MASSKLYGPGSVGSLVLTNNAVRIPKPKNEEVMEATSKSDTVQLPQTLVRIPVADTPGKADAQPSIGKGE